MSAMEELAPYLKEMLRCTRCGFCQAACPTYEETRMESAAARGKIQLLVAMNEGHLELTDRVAAHIHRCVDCRMCQQTCPGGVRAEVILQGARAWLAGTDCLPQPLKVLGHHVTEHHNVLGEDNARRLLWQESLEPHGRAAGSSELAFFVGCVSSLDPMLYGIPQSLVKILERAGVGYVTLGGEEWCCGYPLLEAGLNVDELVAHNVAAVEALGVRWLVATCASCYRTWKTVYPKSAVEVLHATELLSRLLEEGRLTPSHPPSLPGRGGATGPVRVTYHDPCELGRKSGVYDPPRDILKRVPGIQLVEMAANRANAACCGGGGNLESTEAELSAAIADRRLGQALAAGADAIVTACPRGQRILEMAARRAGLSLPVLDVTQILWASLS